MKLGLVGFNMGAATGPDEVVEAARAAEEALEHLWYDERPEFRGRFASFGGIDGHPRPVQQPVPIVLGGNSPPALPACGGAPACQRR